MQCRGHTQQYSSSLTTSSAVQSPESVVVGKVRNPVPLLILTTPRQGPEKAVESGNSLVVARLEEQQYPACLSLFSLPQPDLGLLAGAEPATSGRPDLSVRTHSAWKAVTTSPGH